ncbi:upstream stimulatory factor 1-like isoform X2 [Artemia franciscana]|uniref:upstream stimulatory factor 1-like isoform X2 n=1 Tax=Artemia franciscana TaxID=6661 RepID=UPI0032DB8FE7
MDVKNCVGMLEESHHPEISLDDEDDPLSYQVVHISSENIDGISDQTSGLSSVFAAPLNGVYLMTDSLSGRSTDYYRPIAPKKTQPIGQNKSGNLSTRENRRKQNHNEIERKRRDKINEWITTLGKLVPGIEGSEGKGSTQSKGFILSRACDHIVELRQDNAQLLDALKDHDSLNAELEIMKQELNCLVALGPHSVAKAG